MKNNYSISAIIPVYNEIKLLEKSVEYIITFFQQHFADYEIIIIESGSTDGSYDVCDKIADGNSHIKVIHERARNGFGSALKLGYKKATKDLIWLITVDLPFPLESIHQALPLFDKFDCVLSYRSEDSRNIFRRIQSFVYNTLVKTSLGLKVKHINSAFKVFKREIIQDLHLISNGWFIDAEILYRITKNKISYTEIPIPIIVLTMGKSTVNGATFISILKEMAYFMRKRNAFR